MWQETVIVLKIYETTLQKLVVEKGVEQTFGNEWSL